MGGTVFYFQNNGEQFFSFVSSTDFCFKCADDYVNRFDEPVVYMCPPGMYLAGVQSYHANFYEDRRFKYQCCRKQGRQTVYNGRLNTFPTGDIDLSCQSAADLFNDNKIDDNSKSNNNNNNNNNRKNETQRRNYRFFFYNLTAPLSSTRTLKRQGRNSVKVRCNISSAYHMQHAVCHVVRRDSAAVKSDRIETAFFSALLYCLKPLLSKTMLSSTRTLKRKDATV